MQRIPDLGKKRINLGPGAVIPALPLTFGAPVPALKHQPRTGFKGMSKGAPEGLPADPEGQNSQDTLGFLWLYQDEPEIP